MRLPFFFHSDMYLLKEILNGNTGQRARKLEVS